MVLGELKRNGVEHVCWLPDSETHFLHDAFVADPDIAIVQVCAEGEALAIAAGLNVGGSGATVLIEDQGLFDAGNALKWLKTLDTPIVLLIGYLFYRTLGRNGYLEPFL